MDQNKFHKDRNPPSNPNLKVDEVDLNADLDDIDIDDLLGD